MIALAPSTLAPSATALRVKLFADGADLDSLVALARDPAIAGFTTNPTLMRKAGVADYAAFAREVLAVVAGPPDLVRGLRRRTRRDAPPGDAASPAGAATSS